jgi:hypothetical protein
MNDKEKLNELSHKAHEILLEAQELADKNDIAFRFTFPWDNDKITWKYRKKELSHYQIIREAVEIVEIYETNKEIKKDIISYLIGLLENNHHNMTDEIEYINFL